MSFIAILYSKEGVLISRDLKLYGYRGLIVVNFLKMYATLREGVKMDIYTLLVQINNKLDLL